MEERVITMPVLALRGITILPGMVQHFDINRPKSVAAVEKAMVGDQRVFLVAQRHPEVQDPKLEDLYQVGTISGRGRWCVFWWRAWSGENFSAWTPQIRPL